jgi:hypothetical protein
MRALALVMAALAWGVPATSHAGGGESALSASVGWSTYVAPSEKQEGNLVPQLGGALAVEYERAVGEAFSVRAELVIGGYLDDLGNSGMIVGGLAGVYRFDVLKYVPYAFAGAGGMVSGGGPLDTTLDPAAYLGAGLDILGSRAISWGLEFRLVTLVSDLTVVTVGLRGTTRWGFF